MARDESYLDAKRGKYIGQLELDPLHRGDLFSILSCPSFTGAGLYDAEPNYQI
jgi:hypothetical protein